VGSVLTARRAIGVLIAEGKVQSGLVDRCCGRSYSSAPAEVAAELGIAKGELIRVQSIGQSITDSRLDR
jgi:hypothetical protein